MSSTGSLTTIVAGEEFVLLPSRAVFWPARSMLVVADLHVGKTSAFRSRGVALPRGTTASDLARLGDAIDETGARRLVIAGDLFHAKEGTLGEPMSELRDWRTRYANIDVVVTTGNHDKSSGGVPDELSFVVVDSLSEPPFEFSHKPNEQRGSFVIAGHLHPVALLHSRANGGLRLPCFHFGSRVGVLPAFSLFTGGSPIDPVAGDRVFVVAGDEVVPVLAQPYQNITTTPSVKTSSSTDNTR